MGKLIIQIIAGVASLWLAAEFVPKVDFVGDLQYLFLAGGFMGIINFFIKPILKIITLPLKILTFGLFSLVINMAMVWIVDIFFPELIIQGIVPLFWTTLVVWGVSILLGLYTPRRRVVVREE